MWPGCKTSGKRGTALVVFTGMNLRFLSILSSVAIAATVLGQEKATLTQQVMEAERKCTERIRSTAPQSDALARNAMNTCRKEREAAEAEDLNSGNQDAEWKFVRKYNSADTTGTK